MKAVFATIAILMSSMVLPTTSSATSTPPGCENGRSTAQTCTATFYGPVSVTAFIPCLNNGRGENVTFTDTETTVLFYKVTAGKRNGFLMTVGGGMHGKGQTTGIDYTARGSTQQSLANWVPYNPDGSQNGDGDFTYTDNYYINSTSPVTNRIWHRTQRFSITNNGVNFTLQPDEVVCK